MPVRFQSETIIITSNLVASRFHEFLHKKSNRFVNRGLAVEATKPVSTNSLFPNYQNIDYLYNISFILDRCRRSWDAETHGKYSDLKHLTYTFIKSKYPVNG